MWRFDARGAYLAGCEIQGKNNSILPCLHQQMVEVEKGIDNLVNAIQMGICNDATKKRMDELEARKTELKIQIAKEELLKPLATKEEIVCWLQHFRTFYTNKFEHRENIVFHSSGHKTMLCFAQMKLRQAANDVMLCINDVAPRGTD